MKETIELNLSGAVGSEKDWKVTLVNLPNSMQSFRGHVTCWINADDNFRIASVAYPDFEVTKECMTFYIWGTRRDRDLDPFYIKSNNIQTFIDNLQHFCKVYNYNLKFNERILMSCI